MRRIQASLHLHILSYWSVEHPALCVLGWANKARGLKDMRKSTLRRHMGTLVLRMIAKSLFTAGTLVLHPDFLQVLILSDPPIQVT